MNDIRQDSSMTTSANGECSTASLSLTLRQLGPSTILGVTSAGVGRVTGLSLDGLGRSSYDG